MYWTPSRHHGYAVSWLRASGCSQYRRSAFVSAVSKLSRLAWTWFESGSRNSLNHRSPGLSSGLYAGKCTGSVPGGQVMRWLVWAPLLSSTMATRLSGNACRHSRKNSSKHTLSSRGRNRQKLWPVVGSTAAYSQSHSYWSSYTQGGRVPGGHQRRRYQTLSPKRASSRAHTRCTCRWARVGPKVFFKNRLGGEAGLAVPSAPGLELSFVSFKQLGDAVEAVVVNPPLLAQVALHFLEAGDPTRLHFEGQGVPCLSTHLLPPAGARLSAQQCLKATGRVGRSPPLQLALVIAQQRCRGLQATDGAGFQHAQQLDTVRERPAPKLSFQCHEGWSALGNPFTVVDLHNALARIAGKDGFRGWAAILSL
jgi:hypothetical protein